MRPIVAELLSNFFDWLWSGRTFGDRLGLVALVVELVGFAFVLREVSRVRRRVSDAVGRISLLQAIAAAEDLRTLARDLRLAIADDTAVETVSILLERCGRVAPRLRGLLEQVEDPRAEDLIALLIQAAGHVYPTGEAVRGGGERTLKQKTTRFRRVLDEALGEFDRLSAAVGVPPTE